jgi:hypothetical protein
MVHVDEMGTGTFFGETAPRRNEPVPISSGVERSVAHGALERAGVVTPPSASLRTGLLPNAQGANDYGEETMTMTSPSSLARTKRFGRRCEHQAKALGPAGILHGPRSPVHGIRVLDASARQNPATGGSRCFCCCCAFSLQPSAFSRRSLPL